MGNKYRRSISIRIDSYKRVLAYCEENHISMSSFVEKLVKDALGDYVASSVEYPVFVPPVDPLIEPLSSKAPALPNLPKSLSAEDIFTF